MKAKEFRAIRKGLGLEQLAWGRALGYQGEIATVQRNIRRFESGDRRIPPTIALLAKMFKLFGIPKGWDK